MLFKQVFLGLGALVVSVLAGLVSVAHAGDIKIVGGNQCRQIPRDFQWSLRTNGGVNETTSSIDVICPLSRDNTSSTMGLTSLRVRGFLHRSGDTLSCTVFSLSGLDGRSLGSSTKTVSAGTQGFYTLEWGGVLVQQTNSDSMYSLACTVPPSGAIISIKYDEAN